MYIYMKMNKEKIFLYKKQKEKHDALVQLNKCMYTCVKWMLDYFIEVEMHKKLGPLSHDLFFSVQ